MPLQSLVSQRNDLVHNYNVNKFDSKSSKRRFVQVSNSVLNTLKEAVASGRYESSIKDIFYEQSAPAFVAHSADTDLGWGNLYAESVQGGEISDMSTKPSIRSSVDSESGRVTRRPMSSSSAAVDTPLGGFEIKSPGKHTLNAKELMKFHCWNMIKMDPRLQKNISEDVDGLFEGLLPMNLEDYISIVPK